MAKKPLAERGDNPMIRRDMWADPCYVEDCPRLPRHALTQREETRFYCSAHCFYLMQAEPDAWVDDRAENKAMRDRDDARRDWLKSQGMNPSGEDMCTECEKGVAHSYVCTRCMSESYVDDAGFLRDQRIHRACRVCEVGMVHALVAPGYED